MGHVRRRSLGGLALEVLAVVAVVLGLTACAFAASLVVTTASAEHRAQALLAERLHLHPLSTRSSSLVAVPALRTAPPLGAPVGWLTIPTLHLHQVIVQGTDEAELEDGPGHYPATPLPGEAGDAAIAGHRTTWARPFWSLDQLHPGDQIVVRTPQGRFTFTVQWTAVVLPTDLAAVTPSTRPTLTLSTCTPRYSASHRLVVHAALSVEVLAGVREVTPRWSAPLPRSPRHPGWALACLLLAIVAGLGVWFAHRRALRLVTAVVALAGILGAATLATHVLPGGF